MTTEKTPKSKYFFLTVSILIHAALIYYIGYKALDYALPKGEVSSYEMNFQAGTKAEPATNVDVVEKKQKTPPPQAPAIKDLPKPKPIAKAEKPIEVPPKGDLPVKEASTPTKPEEAPAEDAMAQAQEDSLKKQDEEQPPQPPEPVEDVAKKTEPAPEVPAESTSPDPQPAIPTAQQAEVATPTAGPVVTNGSGTPGAPNGVQSDTVLIPFGNNRPISYPMMARLRKIEGETIVHYTVDAQGNVTKVDVIQSSGSGVLDNQVISTIKDWKFKPTGSEGIYERPVRFSLKGEAQEAPGRLRRLSN